MDWTILLEEGENNWSAYCPDLPGCVATGKTKDETTRNMKEAIEFHLEGMREDHIPIPSPTVTAALVKV